MPAPRRSKWIQGRHETIVVLHGSVATAVVWHRLTATEAQKLREDVKELDSRITLVEVLDGATWRRLRC